MIYIQPKYFHRKENRGLPFDIMSQGTTIPSLIDSSIGYLRQARRIPPITVIHR